jgi:hypothetical protein
MSFSHKFAECSLTLLTCHPRKGSWTRGSQSIGLIWRGPISYPKCHGLTRFINPLLIQSVDEEEEEEEEEEDSEDSYDKDFIASRDKEDK